jgi:hypothetical protein
MGHSANPASLELPEGLEPPFSTYDRLVRNQSRYGSITWNRPRDSNPHLLR